MPQSPQDLEGNFRDSSPLLDEEEGYRLGDLDTNGSASHSKHRITSGLNNNRQYEHTIAPILPQLQNIPIKSFNRLASTQLKKRFAFVIAIGLWVTLFGSLLARGASTSTTGDVGPLRRLSCTATPWPNDDRNCGVNGTKCLPFDHSTFAFRCPPDCASTQVLEPRFVGSQPIRYRPWVIGGDTTPASTVHSLYRGDSWICGAAIHAGIIQSSAGGCGLLSLRGEQSDFVGLNRNGISSMPFDSTFPISYTIAKLDGPDTQCYDRRFSTLSISILLTTAIGLLTISASLFYFTSFTIGFFQVALISDVPDFDTYLLVVQTAVARYLPAIFVSYAIYIFCARRTLHSLPAHVEKTVLWLGGFWFGALENYTLDKLPLQRLTPGDLSQPGAWLVLIVIIALVAVVALVQAYAFYRDGRFKRYLILYLALIFALAILSLLPSLNLRIHHYILALVLLPGTAIQTRPSLLFQGLLVGLFVNGVARWGFASILETDASLNRKGPLGTPLPNITTVNVRADRISFVDSSIPVDWDGISMLVNGVERIRMAKGQGSTAFLRWSREAAVPLYFRFGFFRQGFVDGILQGDYTNPGTWFSNGTWTSYVPANS